MMRFIAIAAVAFAVSGCESDANVASRNLSKAADMFEVDRRIVFLNGITDAYLLSIEGRCSLNHQAKQLEVTCKTGENRYRKHFLGLSDNVTYFAEQLTAADVSVFHYRVVFKPQVLIPEVDARGSIDDLTTDKQ